MKTIQKMYRFLELFEYRVLLIEHMSNLSFSYCSSYFFNKKKPLGINLFHEIINCLLFSSDYGVQCSAYSIIRNVIGGNLTYGVDDHFQPLHNRWIFKSIYVYFTLNSVTLSSIQSWNNHVLLILMVNFLFWICFPCFYQITKCIFDAFLLMVKYYRSCGRSGSILHL